MEGASRHLYASRSQTVNPSEGPGHAVGPLALSGTAPAPPPRAPPPGARRPTAGPTTAFDSSPFPTCAALDARGIPAPESPCRPYGSARRGAGRCRRNVPSPAAALGLRWPDLEPGRTRTDDLPLTRPPLAAHQPLPATTVHRDAAQDAVGIPVRRQFVSQTVSQAIKLLGARVVLRCAPGWSLRVGGRVRGDAVEYSVKSPEVLLGGDVAGEVVGRCGGAGIVLGRCRRRRRGAGWRSVLIRGAAGRAAPRRRLPGRSSRTRRRSAGRPPGRRRRG